MLWSFVHFVWLVVQVTAQMMPNFKKYQQQRSSYTADVKNFIKICKVFPVVMFTDIQTYRQNDSTALTSHLFVKHNALHFSTSQSFCAVITTDRTFDHLLNQGASFSAAERGPPNEKFGRDKRRSGSWLPLVPSELNLWVYGIKPSHDHGFGICR